MSDRRHILVLGDQLNRSAGPLASAVPEGTTVRSPPEAGSNSTTSQCMTRQAFEVDLFS